MQWLHLSGHRTHHHIFIRPLSSKLPHTEALQLSRSHSPLKSWVSVSHTIKSLLLSLLLLPFHWGLTSWTWSFMHPLLIPFHSHCSLATSYMIICTGMASFAIPRYIIRSHKGFSKIKNIVILPQIMCCMLVMCMLIIQGDYWGTSRHYVSLIGFIFTVSQTDS